jgi:tetratricopeptide (TPR) repeat protein
MDRFDWIELEGIAHAPQPGAERETAFKRVRPHDAPSYVAAAHEMRAAGHWTAAAEFFRKAVGLDDHDYAAWTGLVDSLVRARQLASADAASVEALDNYRQVRPLYAARALVLGHLDKLDEAFKHSDVSVDDGDASWYARCVRGELFLMVGEAYRFDALDCFDKAIALADKPWEACLLSGLALLDKHMPVLAASFLADAAHHNPRAAVCWLSLGDSFRDLRLFDQAVFYYQRVMELEPTHEVALASQKQCHPRLFGLMSAFRRPNLRARWRKEFDKVLQREGR